MSGKLRFEAWTLPTAATFERKEGTLPVESASGRRELSAFSDCQCTIPQSFDGLATLATAPLIRVCDGTTVVDEFVAERAPRPLDLGEFVAYSGPQLGQWGLSRILVYPPDYGTNPSKRPNWKWGMENLIELDVGGLGNTNEEWSLYLSGERYELDVSLATSGTFTLTVGGNTTSAIDWDATASEIASALEGLAGVTTVTVDQPDPDTREYFVVFENPKNLASDMTADFGSLSVSGTLTKLSDGFDTGSDPTFTITVDGQTTSNLAWDSTANQVEGSATGNTGLQGLSNVSDVAVSGSGTYDDPWLITFFNPPDIDSFTVTFAAGTAVYSRTVAGGYSADPVTISKPIDEGTGPEEVHGSYGNPALEVVTDVVDTGADFSVLVRARSTFAGSQIVLNVEEGELYQASIRVRPVADSEYVLVVHDENQNQIARTSDTAISADTWATLSLSDILIPAGVERVIMRVAVVSSTTGNHYVNWQGAEFITGLAPTNPGDIVSTILDWSQTQGDGDWIDVTFDDSTDTASTSWTQDYSYQADGFAMHLLHVLEDMRDLGYEFTLTPKSSPSAGKTHDLNLYMPEGAGTDRTSTGPALVTGGAIVGGQVVDRIPDFTVGVAWGADDLYLEDENATTKASYGRLTRVFDVEHHGNSDSLQDVLDTAFDDEESNRQAASVTLRGSGNDVPFVDFTVGDTLVWQAADRMAKNDRRVATITWKHRAGEVAEYEVQGSRVWGDPIAAIAEGLRRLMDAPKKRKRRGDGPGIDRSAASGGSVGAHIHLERTSTLSIAAAGTAITWQTEYFFVQRQNFAAVSNSTDIVIQERGYYDVSVTASMAAAVDGAQVWVERVRDGNALTVWPPSSNDTWNAPFSSQYFEGVAPAIPFISGDIVKVYVAHGEASAQNLSYASVAVYLVDRTIPSSSGEEPYRDLILSQGPIAYWRLGEELNPSSGAETAHDTTGNGHEAIYQPGSGTQASSTSALIVGTSDGATSFPGSGSVRVEYDETRGIGSLADFDVSEITVKAWVTTTANGVDTIVARFDQTGTELWDLATTSGAGTVFFKEYGSNNTVTSLTSINDGSPHHVVATYDGTTARIYIDGQLDNSATWSVTLPTASTTVSVGAVKNGLGFWTEWWDGVIDEVAIWGRALSASEIAAQNALGRSG